MQGSNKERSGLQGPIRLVALEDMPNTGQTLYRYLDRFPQDAQEFITGLSSSFLEHDIHSSYQEDPDKVSSIAGVLRGFGVGEADIQTVMHFFSLPFKPLEK